MKTENIFTERQHFKQIWLWALLILINGIFIYGLVSQVLLGQTFGDKPISNGLLFFVTLGVLLMSLLFLSLRLDTVIKQDGIYFRFLPFHWTYKKISWDSVSASFVRQYNPIAEYGGWGLRFGSKGKGQALNVSGNKGLQLVYDNGKMLLLGTQRPDELERALKQFGRLTTDH